MYLNHMKCTYYCAVLGCVAAVQLRFDDAILEQLTDTNILLLLLLLLLLTDWCKIQQDACAGVTKLVYM
jgi:hypothetical protein